MANYGQIDCTTLYVRYKLRLHLPFTLFLDNMNFNIIYRGDHTSDMQVKTPRLQCKDKFTSSDTELQQLNGRGVQYHCTSQTLA